MPTRRALLAWSVATLTLGSLSEALAVTPRSDLFDLDPRLVHLAGLLQASHPEPVQRAIATYRAELDRNPASYLNRNYRQNERRTREAAARFLGARPDEIGLTFNTTTGLGLLYGGVVVRRGQELLTTEHDYSMTHDALDMRAARTGASVRKIRLYDHGAAADEDEMIERLVREIRDHTRVVALTWVHSSTGVKLPLQRMAERIHALNQNRAESDRVLVMVDAVHALGVEDFSVDALGVDFLAAGTHKWLNGPRGTGLVYGTSRSHGAVEPVLPTFTHDAGWGGRMSPGGFHAFEHRWAVREAFALQESLGRERIQAHIHALASQLKQGLAPIRSIELHTPSQPRISSGIVCFTVRGRSPRQMVDALRSRGIIASTTPYSPSYARLTPGLMNSSDDVDKAIAALRSVA